MSYRPICDTWFLARAKLMGGVKYYGAYLGGFPERARALLGVNIHQPLLHVCGGMAHLYPYYGGYGKLDARLDLAPDTKPEWLQDARQPWPEGYDGYLADPPYSEPDAAHYTPGAVAYPKPNEIIKRGFEVMQPGQRVGLIHYVLPSCPSNGKFIAAVGIMCGFNNRIRVFSVFEKLAEL